SFGGTIPVARGENSTHGVYLGIGPYLTMRTTTDVDPRLTALLAATQRTVVSGAQLPVANTSEGQGAFAITGGYRGRFALTGAAAVSLAATYSYLTGFLYENADVRLRLDTDAAGLVTATPGATPLFIARLSSATGHGAALDVGAGAVLGPFALAFGANGLTNH